MKTLEQAAQIALVMQALLIFVSLVFIWIQLRQNAEIAKAANAQMLVQHAMTFTSTLLRDSGLARLWYSHGVNFADETSVALYREMLIQWLTFHENIFYQHKRGLLDENIYKSWREDLKYTVKHHNLDVISTKIDVFFPQGFGQHILNLGKERQDPDFALDLSTQTRRFVAYQEKGTPEKADASSAEDHT